MRFLQNIAHAMIPASKTGYHVLRPWVEDGIERRSQERFCAESRCWTRHDTGEKTYIDGTERIYRRRPFSGSVKISLITVYWRCRVSPHGFPCLFRLRGKYGINTVPYLTRVFPVFYQWISKDFWWCKLTTFNNFWIILRCKFAWAIIVHEIYWKFIFG